MENKKVSAPMQAWGKHMKGKMVFARLMGFISCLACVGALALLYFKLLDRWTCMVLISFAMATIFIANSYLQSVKTGRTWQVVNLVISFVFYAAVITFVTIGFVEGTITLWF